MKRRVLLFSLLVVLLFAMPYRSPAPLIYRAGEGWTYERVGGGKWLRDRAKDQYEVAQQAFDRHDFGVALKASRRTVKVWPLSDYAPKAQYLVGRAYEAKGNLERSFKEYQKLVEKHPKVENYQETLSDAVSDAAHNAVSDAGFFRAYGEPGQACHGQIKRDWRALRAQPR